MRRTEEFTFLFDLETGVAFYGFHQMKTHQDSSSLPLVGLQLPHWSLLQRWPELRNGPHCPCGVLELLVSQKHLWHTMHTCSLKFLICEQSTIVQVICSHFGCNSGLVQGRNSFVPLLQRVEEPVDRSCPHELMSSIHSQWVLSHTG